jgi:hypothetical protein
MPLKDIKEVLRGEALGLASALKLQRGIMLRKRSQIDAALTAIERAEHAVHSGDSGRWTALREVMKAMKEQQDWEWVKQHYTPEQLERLSQRYDPALQETYTRQWADLMADAERLKQDDPASPQAQVLARRWSEMIFAFTNGEPDIEANLKNVYSEKASQPKGFVNPLTGEVGAFINRALEIYNAGR